MTAAHRFLFLAALAGLLAAPAQARLGETLTQIKKQFDRPPEPSQRKGSVYWLIEGEDGLLLYTVNFNSKGRSISEGLKPVKRARFTQERAKQFITAQTAHLLESKTLQHFPPGGKYRFANQDFTCGQFEQVLVDEPNGLLLIWNKSIEPSVVVVSPEVFQPAK